MPLTGVEYTGIAVFRAGGIFRDTGQRADDTQRSAHARGQDTAEGGEPSTLGACKDAVNLFGDALEIPRRADQSLQLRTQQVHEFHLLRTDQTDAANWLQRDLLRTRSRSAQLGGRQKPRGAFRRHLAPKARGGRQTGRVCWERRRFACSSALRMFTGYAQRMSAIHWRAERNVLADGQGITPILVVPRRLYCNARKAPEGGRQLGAPRPNEEARPSSAHTSQIAVESMRRPAQSRHTDSFPPDNMAHTLLTWRT